MTICRLEDEHMTLADLPAMGRRIEEDFERQWKQIRLKEELLAKRRAIEEAQRRRESERRWKALIAQEEAGPNVLPFSRKEESA